VDIKAAVGITDVGKQLFVAKDVSGQAVVEQDPVGVNAEMRTRRCDWWKLNSSYSSYISGTVGSPTSNTIIANMANMATSPSSFIYFSWN
jgi:hypothetical protein